MMSSSASLHPAAPARRASKPAKAIALLVLFGVGVYFVSVYVFHYYLHYNRAGFQSYWPHRGTLLVHISSGMVALLSGPWQFSNRLRQRYVKLHRVMGRVYLIAIALGALASLRLAYTTTLGWAWAVALVMLAVAWLATSGVAFYAILHRHVAVHKDWMVRSYVVTFAFVLFRLLNDYGPTSRVGSDPIMRAVTYAWLAWTLPLLATEVILQLKNLPRKPAPARS
jgi:uncharacterized membrane protein